MRGAILLPLLVMASPAMAQRDLAGPGAALLDILPPAPAAGSPKEAADRAIFRATRTPDGGPR